MAHALALSPATPAAATPPRLTVADRIAKTLDELSDAAAGFLLKLQVLLDLPLYLVEYGLQLSPHAETLKRIVPRHLVNGIYFIHKGIPLPEPLTLDSCAAYFDDDANINSLQFYLSYFSDWERTSDGVERANTDPSFKVFAANLLSRIPGLSPGRTVYNLLYAPIAHVFQLKNLLETLVRTVHSKEIADAVPPALLRESALCRGYIKLRDLIAKLNAKMAHVKDKADTLTMHSRLQSDVRAFVEPGLASRVLVRQGEVQLTTYLASRALRGRPTAVSLALYNDILIGSVPGYGDELIGHTRQLSVSGVADTATDFVVTTPRSLEGAGHFETRLVFRASSASAAAEWVHALRREAQREVSLVLSALLEAEGDEIASSPSAAAASASGADASHFERPESGSESAPASARGTGAGGTGGAGGDSRLDAMASHARRARDRASLLPEHERLATVALAIEAASARERDRLAEQYDRKLAENAEVISSLRASIDAAAQDAARAHDGSLETVPTSAFMLLQDRFAELSEYADKQGMLIFEAKQELANTLETLDGAQRRADRAQAASAALSIERDELSRALATTEESHAAALRELGTALEESAAREVALAQRLAAAEERAARAGPKSGSRPRGAATLDAQDADHAKQLIAITRELKAAFAEQLAEATARSNALASELSWTRAALDASRQAALAVATRAAALAATARARVAAAALAAGNSLAEAEGLTASRLGVETELRRRLDLALSAGEDATRRAAQADARRVDELAAVRADAAAELQRARAQAQRARDEAIELAASFRAQLADADARCATANERHASALAQAATASDALAALEARYRKLQGEQQRQRLEFQRARIEWQLAHDETEAERESAHAATARAQAELQTALRAACAERDEAQSSLRLALEREAATALSPLVSAASVSPTATKAEPPAPSVDANALAAEIDQLRGRTAVYKRALEAMREETDQLHVSSQLERNSLEAELTALRARIGLLGSSPASPGEL